MSRIGRLPIDVPAGVTVDIKNNNITVNGPKGTLTRDFVNSITIKFEDNKILVTRSSDEKEARAFHGLTRSLVANMVTGVTKGFEKTLEINGVGYKAVKKEKGITLSLGFSHLVNIDESNGITFDIPDANKIIVKGIDKQEVGEIAAQIRKIRPPEPYKGKGVKYSDEVIRRKEGKTGK